MSSPLPAAIGEFQSQLWETQNPISRGVKFLLLGLLVTEYNRFKYNIEPTKGFIEAHNKRLKLEDENMARSYRLTTTMPEAPPLLSHTE